MRNLRFTICDLRCAQAAWVLALVLAVNSLAAQENLSPNTQATRTIGIEGKVSVELPRPDYLPRPLDDRTELILRIGSIAATTNGMHRYDFYYMGLEPGGYELADYLIRPDGSRPDELDGIMVQVKAVLPEDHDGQLTRYVPQAFPFIGGYRAFLISLGVLWVGGIAAFVWSYRRKRPVIAPEPVVVPPSFAERLRPLIEAAAAGRLSTEEKAQIERLLMGFWREKLNLPELRMAEALPRLRNHPEAGELLRALERWLHQRSGASAVEINSLLEPYRHAAPETASQGAIR